MFALKTCFMGQAVALSYEISSPAEFEGTGKEEEEEEEEEKEDSSVVFQNQQESQRDGSGVTTGPYPVSGVGGKQW